VRSALLLSIHHEFAEKIFLGRKCVELRRRRPNLQPGDYLFIYVPAPYKALMGVAVVRGVLEAPIGSLWRSVKADCGISRARFRGYFAGRRTGVAIVLSRRACFTTPVELAVLRCVAPRFSPQGYRYVRRSDVLRALRGIRARRKRRLPGASSAHALPGCWKESRSPVDFPRRWQTCDRVGVSGVNFPR